MQEPAALKTAALRLHLNSKRRRPGGCRASLLPCFRFSSHSWGTAFEPTLAFCIERLDVGAIQPRHVSLDVVAEP